MLAILCYSIPLQWFDMELIDLPVSNFFQVAPEKRKTVSYVSLWYTDFKFCFTVGLVRAFNIHYVPCTGILANMTCFPVLFLPG